MPTWTYRCQLTGAFVTPGEAQVLDVARATALLLDLRARVVRLEQLIAELNATDRVEVVDLHNVRRVESRRRVVCPAAAERILLQWGGEPLFLRLVDWLAAKRRHRSERAPDAREHGVRNHRKGGQR